MSCILVRAHHVLGDGISYIQVLSQLVTTAEGKTFTLPISSDRSSLKSGSFFTKVAAIFRALWPVLCGLIAVLKSTLLTDSIHPLNARLKKYSSDQAVFTTSISLDCVKVIKNRLNCTVNDVILCEPSISIFD